MKTIKIGRGPGNDVVINDGVVSTNHAVITVSDFGEITIEDLHSTNGTFVNGKRITGKVMLTPASTVVLGNHSVDWKQMIQKASAPAPKQPKAPVSIPANVVDKKMIGRNPMAQIRYNQDDVSDTHAFLCKQADGQVLLIDNHSTNGTYVNGSRINGQQLLRKGDQVALSGKHPLNWEAVYPAKSPVNTNLIVGIAVAVLLVIGVVMLKPWNMFHKDWTTIYAEHKYDVALIYVQCSYDCTVQGKPLSAYLNGYNELDHCYVNEEGEVKPGVVAATGTGFFISSDGKMLTNRHVVAADAAEKKNEAIVQRVIQSALAENGLNQLAANLTVKYTVHSVGIARNDTHISTVNDLVPCTVLKVSDKEELDVAMIQTNNKLLPAGCTVVDLSKAVPSEKLSIGTPICTIGFPKSFILGQTSAGLEANNQSGEITQERGTYEYGHNITIQHGASGSPVYDNRGRFAGIIVSGFLGISQGYNQAIHPTPVLDFVK